VPVQIKHLASKGHLAEGALPNEFKHMVIIEAHPAVRGRGLSCYISGSIPSCMCIRRCCSLAMIVGHNAPQDTKALLRLRIRHAAQTVARPEQASRSAGTAEVLCE
jgi:hypothetical protein